MVAALELNGKSPATVEAYVREVALLSKFYRKRSVALLSRPPLLLDLSAAQLPPGPFCRHCGGRLRLLAIQLPHDRFRHPPPLVNTA
jgi:hypothetical protein